MPPEHSNSESLGLAEGGFLQMLTTTKKSYHGHATKGRIVRAEMRAKDGIDRDRYRSKGANLEHTNG
jgi:hypothetical protein